MNKKPLEFPPLLAKILGNYCHPFVDVVTPCELLTDSPYSEWLISGYPIRILVYYKTFRGFTVRISLGKYLHKVLKIHLKELYPQSKAKQSEIVHLLTRLYKVHNYTNSWGSVGDEWEDLDKKLDTYFTIEGVLRVIPSRINSIGGTNLIIPMYRSR